MPNCGKASNTLEVIPFEDGRWCQGKSQSAWPSLLPENHSLARYAALQQQVATLYCSDYSFAINRGRVLLYPLVKSNMKWPIKPLQLENKGCNWNRREWEWEGTKDSGNWCSKSWWKGFCVTPPVLFKLSLRSRRYLGCFLLCSVWGFLL